MKTKQLICLVIAVIMVIVSFSGCSYFDDTTNTTVTTTLSNEELKVTKCNESLIPVLKEKYKIKEMLYLVKYVNFQDLVTKLKSSPDDDYFVGTRLENICTGEYKNRDALEFFNKADMMDATYIFQYRAEKLDSYGETTETLYWVPVIYKDDGSFTYWCYEWNDEYAADRQIICVAFDKCEVNTIVSDVY